MFFYTNVTFQEEKLNSNGQLYIRRNPQLKVKVEDGSSLASAVVVNSIPKGTSQVVLRGHLSKVAYSIALALCKGGIQVYLIINLLNDICFPFSHLECNFCVYRLPC